jgi:PKD repeat protein
VSLTINGDINFTMDDYITVYPTPVAGFEFAQNSFVVTFTNTSEDAVSYLWDFGDGNTSTAENPIHEYGQDGTYQVSLTATSEMCGDAEHSETIIINTVGISEKEGLENLSIYPNPSGGVVYLSLKHEFQNVIVKVFDLQGKILFAQNLSQLKAGTTKLNSFTELRAGIYFVEVQGDQVHYREKLLIK